MNSKVCVIGNFASDYFLVKLLLGQGCVMSLWLFDINLDITVREANA